MLFPKIFTLLAIFVLSRAATAETSIEEDSGSGRYVIEGRVFPLSDYQNEKGNWHAVTRVHVNGGEFIGFVKRDGSFVVHNIPSGSYIVEVLNPEYTFEPVRVEINSKGRFRARKVNHIQASLVNQVPYPLKIKALGKTRYFQVREQWRITDFLFNPMIMMMIFPVLLVMVLPKLMNDPETKKDLEQIQKMAKFDVPQVSDAVSNFLAGKTGTGSQSSTKDTLNKEKDSKKNQKTRRRLVAKE